MKEIVESYEVEVEGSAHNVGLKRKAPRICTKLKLSSQTILKFTNFAFARSISQTRKRRP